MKPRFESFVVSYRARYDSESGNVQQVVYSETQGKQAWTPDVVHEASLKYR